MATCDFKYNSETNENIKQSYFSVASRYNNGTIPADPDSFTLEYGQKLFIDPNGGLYNGSSEVYETVVEEKTVAEDAKRDNHIFMVLAAAVMVTLAIRKKM